MKNSSRLKLLLIFSFILLGGISSIGFAKNRKIQKINSDGLWKAHYFYDKDTNTLIYGEALKNTVYMDLETGSKLAVIEESNGGGTCPACFYVPGKFIMQGPSKLYSFQEKRVYDVQFTEIALDDPDRLTRFNDIQQKIRNSNISYYIVQTHQTVVLINLGNKYYSYYLWDYPYDLSRLQTMQIINEYSNETIFHASKNIPISIAGPDGLAITLTYTGYCFISGCTDRNDLVITRDSRKIYRTKIKNSSIIPFINGKSDIIILGDKTIERISI